MTTTYPLAPHGIFRTIQGEGAMLGVPMVFVRLAGCFAVDDGEGRLIYRDVRNGAGTTVPECDCLACSSLRAVGVDTRQMGSNEHNMGRAVHNINIYNRVFRKLQTATRDRTLFD